MPARQLPVRPNLEQLRQQAKDLLRSLRAGGGGRCNIAGSAVATSIGSLVNRSMALRSLRSSPLQNVIAMPDAPALAVRPIRCT
ncbi:MAG: hypothetical protein HC872_07625 [Gammaproteobacteria bacterium]|nr:hypothetical protein [Gammaproteobacteria bacterium]